MRILMLSLDQALLGSDKQGDTLLRFQQYQQACEYFGVVVPTNTLHKPRKTSSVDIYPAYGRNRISSYFQIYIQSAKLCREKKINLIVTNDAVLGAIAVCLKRQFPVKVQINVFGLEILSSFWLNQRLQNRLLRFVQIWSLKKADSIRTDNSKEKQLLVNKLNIPESKIYCIPVAPSQSSQERFLHSKKDEKLRQVLLNGKKHLVLSVGNLVKAKDYPTFIHAAALVILKNSDTRFIIVGKGEEEEAIKTLIEEKGLSDHITLQGSVDYESIPRLYKSADVFVLSSAHEGFPRVLMEAALSGVPIVTTAIDGAFDIVEDRKTGYIVPVGNYVLLAENIMAVLKNKKKASLMGSKAKTKARKLLEFDTVIDAIISSWKETVYGKV